MGIRDAINVCEYKCPRCSWIALFYVGDDRAYLEEILKLRDGLTLYLPPIKQWMAEHEEIKKRLEIIGYV